MNLGLGLGFRAFKVFRVFRGLGFRVYPGALEGFGAVVGDP